VDLRVDVAAGVLAEPDGDLVPQVVGHEGHPHYGVIWLGPSGVRAESEGPGRLQAERRVSCDREAVHRGPALSSKVSLAEDRLVDAGQELGVDGADPGGAVAGQLRAWRRRRQGHRAAVVRMRRPGQQAAPLQAPHDLGHGVGVHAGAGSDVSLGDPATFSPGRSQQGDQHKELRRVTSASRSPAATWLRQAWAAWTSR